MQHNTLYGRINKKNSKSSESPSSIVTTMNHPQRKIAKLANLQLPTLDDDPTPITSNIFELPEPSYHHIPETTTTPDNNNEDIQCIDTQYFELPSPMAFYLIYSTYFFPDH